MKRTLFILIALCAVVATQAQVGVGYYRSGYGSVQKAQDVGPLTRNHNIYYYHGKPMKRAEMVQFLNENCKEAYDYYRKQQKIEKAGWGLFGSGIGILIIGAGVLGGSEVYEKNNINPSRDTYHAIQWTGVGMMISAWVVGFASIPMIIVGNVQKKNAHKQYNTWFGYKELEQETSQRDVTPLELRLQSSSNGLGLALSF